MIGQSAYLHALARGFADGTAADDWAAAEAEVGARLAERQALVDATW